MELPKKPKTNREKLEGMCIHDLFMSLNSDYIWDNYVCIGEALRDTYMYGEEKERCRFSDSHNCSECISRYLNEEAK